MLFFLILIIPGVLVLVMLIASLFGGVDRSGVPEPSGRRSPVPVEEDAYGTDDDEIAQMRALVGAPRRDRHTEMPAPSMEVSAAGLDDIEIDEFVTLTNSDRRRQGLPPLTRDEVLRRAQRPA